MQFIRISTLRQLFPDQQIPVPSAEAEAFRHVFYASGIAHKNSIPENEQLLMHLQTEAFVLYMDWIEQERQLMALLEGNSLEAFGNNTNILHHALFPAFRKFVTPFLYPVLLDKMRSGDAMVLRNGMTYIPLLEEREADLVQHEVFGHLQRRIEEAETEIRRAKSEDDLLKIFRSYFTPVLFDTLNHFTQSFYRVKTSWLMVFRSLTHHSASTRRLVLHMITELRKLDLNKDHLEELTDLEKSIKIGSVKVERESINIKRTILLSLLGVFIVVLIIVIWKLPTKPVYDKDQEETAFMDFTPAERATMDSLLRNVHMERETPDDRIDQSDMDYVGEELVVNIPWNNQDAEYLISHWREHEADSLAKKPQTEYSKKDARVFPMTESLQDKKGSISAKFQNDTELSVFIMVFRDRADEWVYGQYVEKQGIISFKLNPGEQLLVLPGSKAPKRLNSDETPFEQVDSRFFKALKEPYLVDNLAPSKIKLVWKSVNNRDFYLLDLNKALNK